MLRADLPGMQESDVTIELEDNVLTVRVPKPEQRKPRKITIAAREGEASARM
ncbi:MAG: Hsp20/alpha crystallin family protein [Deltaproteobacteria bacterium]|nr:Hsp20/alpha crystallin family protein [Solirubrobacterales bacterium]MBA3821158.1 Hsp20/alpha crystallin family protein [Deltaproteobacteria bacterium]